MTVASSISKIGETEAIFHQIVQVLQGGWTADYIWQIAAFAVAVLLSLFISRRFNARLQKLLPPPGSDRLRDRVKTYAIDIASHLSFSLIGASFLWMLDWTLREVDILPDHKVLVFAELGYMALYAFAFLRIMLYILRGMLGDKVVTHGLATVVSWVFWILVVLEFAGILPTIVKFMREQSIPVGTQNLTLWTLFSGLVSALLTLGVANWIANVLEGVLKRTKGLAPNLQVVFSRIARWILMVCAILIAMSSVGIDLTVLSVFGGALGVGIGFGLQKIASNYISGFIILLDHSIKIGDFVEIGGFQGIVTEINTRYTVVSDWNGIENIVPNETFVTSSVKNYYHTDNVCIAMIRVSVAYGTDLNKALQILNEEANKPDRVIKNRKGWTGITKLDDSAIDLEAGVWVPNVGDGTVGLRTQVLINVLKRFDEEGIEVPFPQLDVRLRSNQTQKISIEDMARLLTFLEDQKEADRLKAEKEKEKAAGGSAAKPASA